MVIVGKTVLVTGGANGLGLGYVEELLKNGAQHVVIADIDVKKGQTVLDKIKKNYGSGRAIFVKTDVTKAEEFEAAFKTTLQTFKSLDIFINNAGILNEREWELMVDINMKGSIRGLLLAYKYMGKHEGGNGGTVVNTSSIAGIQNCYPIPLYTATKHGIIGLSRSFGNAKHYERTGVKIITLCPGLTKTSLMDGILANCYDDTMRQWGSEYMVQIPLQSTESVSKALIEVLRNAENGSFWVIEGDEPPYEITVPEKWDFAKKVKT